MNGGITMAGNVDKTQYEKYEKLAVFIMPYVRPELIKTYERTVAEHSPAMAATGTLRSFFS